VAAIIQRATQYLGSGKDHVALIVFAVLFAGVALRLWHFSSGRSLWIDEAMVSTSIVGRDWNGLLRPLDYLQIAPIGWLFIEKAALQTIGGLEYALRLPQLIFGLASLAVFVVVARRLFAQSGFVVAIALFALGSHLIYYSAEVKPYGVDAFFSTVFIFFGVRYFWQQAPITIVGMIALATAGAAAAACSFPAIVIMACFGPLIFLREVVHRRFVAVAGVVVVGVFWLAVFAYFFLGFQKPDSPVVEDMAKQWNGGFAPLPPASLADLAWYPKMASDLFESRFGRASTVATFIAALIGAWVLVRKNSWFGASLLAPFAVALILSGLQLYPIGNRLTLYLLPQLILLIAAGVEASASVIRPGIVTTLIATILVFAGSAGMVVQNFTSTPLPYTNEDIRPVLAELASKRTADQPIYVYWAALPAFRLYQDAVGLGDANVIEGKSKKGELGCMLRTIDSLRAHNQIWIVFAHTDKILDRPEEFVFRDFAKIAGREVFARNAGGAHAFLFDFQSRQQEDLLTPVMRAFPPTVSCD
jgi:hypothetical protein